MYKKEIRACIINWNNIHIDVLNYLAHKETFRPVSDDGTRVYYKEKIEHSLEYRIIPLSVRLKVNEFLKDMEKYELIILVRMRDGA